MGIKHIIISALFISLFLPSVAHSSSWFNLTKDGTAKADRDSAFVKNGIATINMKLKLDKKSREYYRVRSNLPVAPTSFLSKSWLNCTERTWKEQILIFYDAANKEIPTTSANMPEPGSGKIEPGSILEDLRKAMCK